MDVVQNKETLEETLDDLDDLDISGFWAMIDFVIELGVGFIYVLYMNALDWE